MLQAVVSGATYTISASSSAGLAATYTSSTPTVCTVSAGNVCSFVAVGSCSLVASQTGNVNYLAAADILQSFSVGPGSQTVTITSIAPTTAVVSGAVYTPTGTSSAG